jgi:hypothetical protein
MNAEERGLADRMLRDAVENGDYAGAAQLAAMLDAEVSR